MCGEEQDVQTTKGGEPVSQTSTTTIHPTFPRLARPSIADACTCHYGRSPAEDRMCDGCRRERETEREIREGILDELDKFDGVPADAAMNWERTEVRA